MRLPIALILVCSLHAATEADLRKVLQTRTGTVSLPGGTIEIAREMVLPPDAHDLTIEGPQTTLKASAAFRGRALLVITGGSNIHLRGLTLEGSRDEIGRMTPPVPSSAMMSRVVANNGLISENTSRLEISGLKALHIAGFAILVNASRQVNLHEIDVNESGGYGLERRNSGMGGILIEEGTADFAITRCLFGKIRGSAIVVRSLAASPLNTRGRIAENEFAIVARDAVEISGASDLLVENNRGRLIGYPVEETEFTGGVLPSAFHARSRLEKSTIRANTFDNIDGRCFTLSGIANSEISANSCTEELFGAMVLEGVGNRVLANHFTKLNLAHKDAPATLTSGIYLGAGARANLVRNNEVAGYGMSRHCVTAEAPGNDITGNDCADESDVARLQRARPRSQLFAEASFPSRQ